MFKKIVLLCAILIGCASAFGEISKNDLKKYSKVVRIDGVQDGAGDPVAQELLTKFHKISNYKDYEILVINFSGGDRKGDAEYLKNVQIRFRMEITDKKTKNRYYFEKKGEFGVPQEGKEYDGTGLWVIAVPCSGQFERVKVSGYAFECGVMDGDVFAPFSEEYDGVDSYEELCEGTTTPFPETCPFSQRFWYQN